MSSLTHGGFMEDTSTDFRSVVLLGPKPRPPIGGQYHPNARQRQAAEAGARRQRVHRLLQIHESRKAVLHLERGLEASRAKLLAMEEEAGVDGVRTLAQFKSPAVPAMAAMLNRKRRLQDAMAGATLDATSRSTSRYQGGEAFGVAVKRHRLEVEDDVVRARRRLEDGLHDGLGILLRHKRLAALQDEEDSRQRVEVFHDDARRRKRFAASQDEELHHHQRAQVIQSDGLCGSRRADVRDEEARWQRSESVQDDALRRKREPMQEDGLHHKRGAKMVQDVALRRQSAEFKLRGLRRKSLDFGAIDEDAVQRHHLEAQEKIETAHRYHGVVRELKAIQENTNEARLKIEVTASSASPPRSPSRCKKLLMDEDVSPMMTAWYGKPGYEPTTPTDLMFRRGPRGVSGATPDPLCRSPNALCRSPCGR